MILKRYASSFLRQTVAFLKSILAVEKLGINKVPERPVVVVQSGDCLENRERVLPLVLTLRDAGWTPVVLVDTLKRGGQPFLMHGLHVVAVRDLKIPEGYKAPTLIPISNLCPLDLQQSYDAGRTIRIGIHRDMHLRYWYAMSCIEPDMVIPWNGFTGYAANALRCYKEYFRLPGGYIERGLVGKSVFFDEDGVNGSAGLARHSGVFQMPLDTEWAAHMYPISQQVLSTSRPISGKTIFVPLQVSNDSNIIMHSHRIKTMRSLVKYALKLRDLMGEDWKVIVRPHPEEVQNIKLNLPISAHINIDATTPLLTCISQASICLTVNSTVGLEAALQGATTVCLGEGIYCRQPFVVQAQDETIEWVAQDLRRRLAQGNLFVSEKLGYLQHLQQFHQIGYAEGSTAEGLAARLRELAQTTKHAKAKHAQPFLPEERGITHCSTSLMKAYQRLEELKHTEGLSADILLSPKDKLFLTYRKTSERITMRYISDVVATRGLNIETYTFIRDKNIRQTSDIAIVSSASKDISKQYRLVLDEYGYPHVSYYT